MTGASAAQPDQAGDAESRPDDRTSWLSQMARAASPYLDGRRINDGDWVRLERADGSAISVRARDLPDIERLARGR